MTESRLSPCNTSRITAGAVWEEWWERTPDRKRLLVSLGTVKPMVDGLDLISWVMDSAGEVDAEIILHLPANAPLGFYVHCRRMSVWSTGLPMGVFLNGADGFIHHGGAGNNPDGAACRHSADSLWPGCRQTRQLPAPWSSADAALFPVRGGLTRQHD
ncbi:Glycosyltransferase IroB [Salmonella sp. NCTC 11881]|nr:Glycosyltransferase IroB [Salmonella sp. NCTC 11881]